MTKLTRVPLFLLCLLMLTGIASRANAQTAASYIATGRGQLANNHNVAGLQAADSAFTSALTIDPTDPTANVLKATTRMALLVTKPEFNALLNSLGVTITDPSPYHFKTQVAKDANGHAVLPSGATTDLVLSYVNNTLLPEVNASIANLQNVTSTNFLLQLSAAETSMLDTNVDYGDVQVALAGLHGIKAVIALANTQNVSASIPVIYDMSLRHDLSVEGLLDVFPNLLTYSGQDQRTASKTAFQSANLAYQVGSNFIRTVRNAIPNTDYLFSIDPNETSREERFRRRLAGVSAALNGSTVIDGVNVNLVPLLTSGTQARSLIPQISGDLILPNTWPDATMAGALPGGTQALLNQAALDLGVLSGPDVTITANPSSGAGGKTYGNSPDGTHRYGSFVRLFASPNPGFTFLNWTENGTPVSVTADYKFKATTNRTLVANFALTPGFYSIAISASQPKANVFLSGGGGYSPGSTVWAYVSPYLYLTNTAYEFVNWTENGTEVSTSPLYFFTATADRNLVANFATGYAIETNVSPQTASASGVSISGNGIFAAGTSVTVTANTFFTGYDFVNWTENGTQVSTSPSYTFPATANRSLVAHVTPSAGNVVIGTGASPVNGGGPFGGGSVSSGTGVSLYAFENPNYTFVNWTENGSQVSTANPFTFTATANRTIVANFAPNSGFYSIAATAAPTAGGSTFVNSFFGAFSPGASVGVNASPNPGYGFVNWTENGTPVSTSSYYAFTVTGNRNLVANFAPAYTITASASPAAGGSATPGNFSGIYNSGSSATVIAKPKPGYSFLNWTLNGVPVSTSTSYTFTATANRNLVANFVVMYFVFANPSPSGGGVIGGSSTGAIAGGFFLSPGFGLNVVPGATVNLTATPNSGGSVDRWWVDGAPVQIGGTTYKLNNVTANHNVAVTFATPTKAQMVSPANGSALGSSSVTFTWNAGTGASGYALWVGSTPGAYDLYFKLEGTSLSDTVNNLPSDGSTVYLRLYSLINGAWVYNSYVYTAVDGRAKMTGPGNSSALGGGSATFSWSAGSGVSQYYLFVGNTPGGNDIYAKLEGASLSDTVNNLPADGRTFYVTLWSQINGKWLPVSYEYTAVDNRTQMASPAGGSRFTSASATFNWGATAGATNYALWVGSSPGTYDLYVKVEGSSLSDTVNNLPVDGRAIYVRLYSMINGVWVYKSYYYTAADNRAQMTSPAINGGAFGASSVNFAWSAGSGVSNYALWVGSSPGGSDLYAKLEGGSLSDTVNNLPVDGRPIYVTLWSYLNGRWVTNSYNYTALDNRARMTSPVNNSVLGSTSVNFTWAAGTGASQYALWVGSTPGAYDLALKLEGSGLSDTVNIASGLMNGHTIYVRLYSMINGAWVYNSYAYTVPDNKAQMTAPASASALTAASATFSWSAGTGVSQYVLWVGSTPGANDLYVKLEGGSLSDTVNNLPTDGRRIYVRLYSLTSAGWRFNAYTYDALKDAAGPVAVLGSPTDGSTLASSSANFSWNAGIGSAYALWVGNTPGGNDLASVLEKNGLTDTVTNLPEDGSPVYSTVWSFINGQWQNTKAHFATTVHGTSPKGLLTGPSPANGSTISSGQLTLNWSAGAAQGTQYALWVGSSPGTYDVYVKLEGTSLSDTVSVPVDGRRLYVVLWTSINGAWQPTTYYYDTTE